MAVGGSGNWTSVINTERKVAELTLVREFAV